jgi:hypothetical protein
VGLAAHPLPDFEDLRHDDDHVRPTEGNVALLQATMAGRTPWGVAALAHEEQVVADPLVGTLNHSAAFMGMLPTALRARAVPPSAGSCSATAASPVTYCTMRRR